MKAQKQNLWPPDQSHSALTAHFTSGSAFVLQRSPNFDILNTGTFSFTSTGSLEKLGYVIKKHSGLLSFRTDWFHLLGLPGVFSTQEIDPVIGRTDAEYIGHLMGRADSSEKTLMMGKTEGGRRRGRQRMRWLDGITNSVEDRGAWCAVVPEVAKSWTWLHDWPLPTTICSHLLDCF